MMIDFEKLSNDITDVKREYVKWNNIDCDDVDSTLTVVSKILSNKYLCITIGLPFDWWDKYMDEYVKRKFNVELVDYQIDYNASYQGFRHDVYHYMYITKGYCPPIDFIDRYKDLDLVKNNNTYVGEEDCRILTHKILTCLREFDNMGFSYNEYLDNIELKQFLGQCECWMEHLKLKEVRD